MLLSILLPIWLLYTLIMIPLQYSYISGMKEKEKKSGLTQSQLYENMPAAEEQLHSHMQGNFFNWPAALISSFIYKHHQKKHSRS
ncbi:DUF3949 domain-containing protein [Bacillus taeanensis]|uniref:DUF3949 domain-containing protein n=1 Tax=Bacillus taeanensis TaxID=273032 RepID=UPI003CCC6B6B